MELKDAVKEVRAKFAGEIATIEALRYAVNAAAAVSQGQPAAPVHYPPCAHHPCTDDDGNVVCTWCARLLELGPVAKALASTAPLAPHSPAMGDTWFDRACLELVTVVDVTETAIRYMWNDGGGVRKDDLSIEAFARRMDFARAMRSVR